jgi:hypothetical protein
MQFEDIIPTCFNATVWKTWKPTKRKLFAYLMIDNKFGRTIGFKIGVGKIVGISLYAIKPENW